MTDHPFDLPAWSANPPRTTFLPTPCASKDSPICACTITMEGSWWTPEAPSGILPESWPKFCRAATKPTTIPITIPTTRTASKIGQRQRRRSIPPCTKNYSSRSASRLFDGRSACYGMVGARCSASIASSTYYTIGLYIHQHLHSLRNPFVAMSCQDTAPLSGETRGGFARFLPSLPKKEIMTPKR